MSTVLFVPTYRQGGLDVLEASLARQIVRPDYVIVADELYDERDYMWHDIFDRLQIDWWSVNAPKVPGYKRNLCANYNLAAEAALEFGADLFISLQDYIWIPFNGIERFEYVHRHFPNDLITGLTSISEGPMLTFAFPQDQTQNFHYSIFPSPYSNKPKTIQWVDARLEIYDVESEGSCLFIEPEHWETNWAAVPVSLFKDGFRWDEDYDLGIAYENMDFAKSVVHATKDNAPFNTKVIMDVKNHAVSLPHKDYFRGEREEIHAFSNKKMYEDRWC